MIFKQVLLIIVFLLSLVSFADASTGSINITGGAIQFPDGSLQTKAAVIPGCTNGGVLVYNSDSWYCGNIMVVPNGVATCIGSVCNISSCLPKMGNCDGDISNGCEQMLTNVNNCGACNHKCAANETCATGVCKVPDVLTISVPSTVNAGKPLQVSATLSSVNGVQGIPVTFTSSDSSIISGATVNTNASGIATVQLNTSSIVNEDFPITITASYGGATNNSDVTVRGNKLVINYPYISPITATAGSSVECFISGAGALVTYRDADDLPLAGESLSLRIYSASAKISDVIFHWNLANTSYLTINPFTFTTLSDGTLPNSILSFIATAPSSLNDISMYYAYFDVTASGGVSPFNYTTGYISLDVSIQ